MFSPTAAVLLFVVDAVSVSGLLGLLSFFGLMVGESFGLPLPSEVILPVAGFVVATGGNPYFTWPTALLAALAGSLLGAIMGYEIGRSYGLSFARRLGMRDSGELEGLFERKGPATVLVARMLPVTHAYVSYPAGAVRMPRAQFSLYALVGSVPFIAVLIGAGFILGRNWAAIEPYFSIVDYTVVAGLIVILAAYLLRRHRRR